MITFPGPTAALVTLPVPPDRTGILRALALERLVHDRIDGVRETVPAFNSLLIEGNPLDWDPDRVAGMLAGVVVDALEEPLPAPPSGTVRLPSCYDPELAPDLIELTAAVGVSVTDFVELHSSREYTVLATGFSPGFAYLGDLDERLAMPRRPSPRPDVPAGAIGIADRRTGVYPTTSPGGWRLVGRVPPSLFADAMERLARFEPGAQVRFEPIDRRAFEAES